MAAVESTALDALLEELESTDVEEVPSPLGASAESAQSNGRKKHKSKSKAKKKKKKREKKAKQAAGATWMPWGADGVAKSTDGESSDEEAIDGADDHDPEPLSDSDPQAVEEGLSGGEENSERNVEGVDEEEEEGKGVGRDGEAVASNSMPHQDVPTEESVPAVKMVTAVPLVQAPPLAALPKTRLPSPQAALTPPPLLAGGGGPPTGPPVRVHPATIAALPLGAASGLSAPPPLVLAPPLSPPPLSPPSAVEAEETPQKAQPSPSAVGSPLEEASKEESRVTSLAPGESVRAELSPGAQPLRAPTPAVKKSMLLDARPGVPSSGGADKEEPGKPAGTRRRLFKSLSKKHFVTERPERSSSDAPPESQPSRAKTADRPSERRRTLNLGSPRDEIIAEKKPRKKGVVRSLSAKGLHFVGKKKESFATLAPFMNIDNNQLCWSNVQPPSPTNEVMEQYLRSFVCDVDSFNYECGAVEATSFQRKLVVEQQQIDIKFFEEYFEKTKFDTYVARNVEHPWILALAKVKSLKKTLVYINNGETVYRLYADISLKTKEVLAQVPKYSPKLGDARFELVKGCTTYPDILRLEQFDHRPQYTIGVLYCAEGQTTEAEMYDNEAGSPEFDEFLSMLGDKIELKGWPRFPGGLDVARNKTGSHALYTMLRNYEVMYHVSTMLPYMEEDEQKIERKRHIGNDMVVVIFKEGSQKIDPKCFSSHFNFVFVVVERVPPEECGDGGIVYSVEFCYSKSAPAPARPALPSPAFLKAGSRSRDLLVTKLMNAERMCLCADEIQEKLRRTKRHMIDFMVERYFRN